MKTIVKFIQKGQTLAILFESSIGCLQRDTRSASVQRSLLNLRHSLPGGFTSLLDV
jgi:hypothetical protein